MARVLCERFRARGALVLVFHEDDRLAGASYGQTREDAKLLRRALEQICTGFRYGELPCSACGHPDQAHPLEGGCEATVDGASCDCEVTG